jgi:two-component system heavy metal sensor histidine kinase CusS
MRLADSCRRALRRTDLRAVLAVGGLLALALAVQAAVLYAYLAEEELEEADRWALHALRLTEHASYESGPGGPIQAELDAVGRALPDFPLCMRVVDVHGAVIASWGTWPDDAIATAVPVLRPGTEDVRGLGAFRLLRSDRFLVADTPLASGGRAEVAVPLAHFAAELGEVRTGLALLLLVSGLAALAIGALATWWAFAPLAGATRMMGEAEAAALRSRLTTRGTGDPVDRHAETVNRVLARIDASFERLRQFSSDVAHELRTPLNRVGNLAEVALRSGDEAELRKALEAILETAAELSRMVDRLLLAAEIDEGRVALRPSALDVDAWLARVAGVYAAVFEEHGLDLRVHTDAGSLVGDRELLDRVLVNLLENALRHAPPGGCVEIGARHEPGEVVLWVDDSGPGIPAEHRERVFDRFARLPGSGGPGSGLGLALARSIVRLHGGELVVEDSPLGGARLRCRLPVRR